MRRNAMPEERQSAMEPVDEARQAYRAIERVEAYDAATLLEELARSS